MRPIFFNPDAGKILPLPLFHSRVQAGFPSPADDSIENRLDLNELIVNHPSATFFVRAVGTSMQGANINDGDILVVDRSITATDGKIVIAILNGEFTVKRIALGKNQITLLPENPNFPPILVSEGMDFEIWGVVTYIIHKCTSL